MQTPLEILADASNPSNVFHEYWKAGHDVQSLFWPPDGPTRCTRCGAYQIDLSEDLGYGEMRKCNQ